MYWYSSRHQRRIDLGMTFKANTVLDADGQVMYKVMPANYARAGYSDPTHTCRLTGVLAVVKQIDSESQALGVSSEQVAEFDWIGNHCLLCCICVCFGELDQPCQPS
jgi:hypothetical protein